MDSQDTPDPDTTGTPGTIERPEHRRRYLDRMTGFSDGVAAIALTLLVLPLVDIAAPRDGQSAWEALADSQTELWAFGVTFLVIAILWMAHNRIFSFIDDYDAPLVWLNTLYLIAIVALPFPSKWLQEDSFQNGVGTFFFSILLLASLAMFLMSRHTRRHPEMLTSEARANMTLVNTGNGPFYVVYLAIGTGVAQFAPDLAGYYLLAMWPLHWAAGKWFGNRRILNA